ncbi:hypothetical protein JGH11_19540, partial [Dysgonomonas sp. Marseille-P4677]|uniref:hypothetical protein n=1 Tax=Dysgonomonas sp. Marseille-P4677 TaxID=2364790 RepID=UPI001912DFAC
MSIDDIKIGNWFIGYDDKPFQWSFPHFALFSSGVDLDEIIKESIILTEENILKFRRIESGNFKPFEFRCVPPSERQIENNYWSGWLDTSVCEHKLHLSPSYGHTWIDKKPVKNNIPEWWFCWYCGDNGWFISMLFKELKYVHQLQ